MGDLSIYKLVASSRFAFYTGTPFWLNSGAVSSDNVRFWPGAGLPART
ncbi:hypothetical protein HNQ95_004024 [Aminobacter ciceronei]|jgi:hypothetical protein|uniref:Uncharacterized protein n=2 Tax=Aminobacter TaxID=31988 RepID=A0AAC8YJ71_AMIAI|nr:hypothetical protein AA2016_0426 [Aminobacter aminovorans]MBA8908236.1 hypothetical protein [Aminobacter ciceronei]MBA9022008.1 hypothetical protein [Aminobacter ciceronei]MBB3707511.1 hypothetical protein [Aminobacter aminovorans]